LGKKQQKNPNQPLPANPSTREAISAFFPVRASILENRHPT
jgi:hypothetical protein